MTYLVDTLIADAYFAADVVSLGFESVSGPEVKQGLRWLNEVLGKKVVEKDMIPYEGQQTFTAVAGQEDYDIDNLIVVDTLTFVKDTVRYPVSFIPRNTYRGQGRVNSISSLPFTYFYERQLGGAKISLYFFPDQAYVFTITGIFRMANVALGQDLELTLDQFYITYLKYALASKICTEYSKPVPMGVAKELGEYEKLIYKQSRPLDLSVSTISTLNSPNGVGAWGMANLFKGFLPHG